MTPPPGTGSSERPPAGSAAARYVWLTAAEHEMVSAAADLLLPGSGALGVADYVDQLLGAFAFDPPRIWAGGPFSGRHGGAAGFDEWIRPSRVEEQAWRQRIGEWQEAYRGGLDALGADFTSVTAAERTERLKTQRALRAVLYLHACEATYGDPVYGGNRDGAGWASIGFDGDTQPRGWLDHEVSDPVPLPPPTRRSQP